jgi:hypothetical protein
MAGCETDHSTPSNAEVKNAWSYTSIPTVRLHDFMLSSKMQREQFTFPLPLYETMRMENMST